MLQKNQLVEMTCENFGKDAEGVCRHEGIAVFVKGMLPGETAMVRITKTEKRYAYGRIDQLLTKSSERRDPFCPIYKRCGGCSCQHMTYKASLEYKRTQVESLISRVGKVDISLPPVLGMDKPFAYRNKASYPVSTEEGHPVCGFYASRSHSVIPLPENGCPLQASASTAAVHTILSWMKSHHIPVYNELTGKGLIRHIVTRSASDGKLMIILVSTNLSLPHKDSLIDSLRQNIPEMASLYVSLQDEKTNVILGQTNLLVWGEKELFTSLLGFTFTVSPLSFFQVNPLQTQKLYSLALEFADLHGTENVVDAYCGTGTISLLCAPKAKHVTGIEIISDAIADAHRNAVQNNITNADFICGASEDVLPRLVADGMSPDVIILDPPRKGCERSVLEAILASHPDRIVYVSCDPATLARDIQFLTGSPDYQISRIQSVDMFCWTSAVETVVCLSNKNAKPKDYVEIGVDAEDYYCIKSAEKDV